MDFIVPFVSIIGVIIGFVLSTIKESIQNRPKVKMSFNNGSFNFYNIESDLITGELISRPTLPKYWDYYKVELVIDIYNYGRGNTAIKSILVENYYGDELIIYSTPNLKVARGESLDYSFNLPSSSINTLELDFKVQKDDNDFSKQLFSDSEVDKILKFKVVATDIHNKKTTLDVNSNAIYIATDLFTPKTETKSS